MSVLPKVFRPIEIDNLAPIGFELIISQIFLERTLWIGNRRKTFRHIYSRCDRETIRIDQARTGDKSRHAVSYWLCFVKNETNPNH